MPSEQIENYLKNIYKIHSVDGKVTTTSLSKNLAISPASVTEMIKKLAEEGIVTHTPYKGVELTPAGQLQALRIIRKHRLWEMFLVDVLKFRWDEIDEEAERFEHIMSEKMEDKIDEILNYPEFDPHGDPIPTKDGKIRYAKNFPLNEAQEGMWCVVQRVSDASSDLLKYVAALGISLNKKIRVKQKLAFDNSMVISINGKEHTISHTICSSVFVEPA